MAEEKDIRREELLGKYIAKYCMNGIMENL